MSDGVVIPWFDQANFDPAREALGEWVTLLERAGSHDEYRLLVEQELRIVAAVRTGTLRVRGLAPVEMDDLRRWLDERRTTLSDIDAFEDYVDNLADSNRVVPWPPGRNDRCWCGSGSKYKKCCGALDVDEQAIADGAANLRETIQHLAELDDEQALTIDDLLDEFDDVADELAAAEPTSHNELLEELRYDSLGGTHYAVLLRIASASNAHDAAGADKDLAPLLRHPLMQQAPAFRHELCLIYAEALHAQARHAAAVDTSTRALDELDRAGVTVSTVDRAIARTYLIDTDGPDAADTALHELLESATTEDDRARVCEIAADHFSAAIEYVHAAPWGERHLRIALSKDSPSADEIKRAAGALQRIYNDADSFADDHVGEPRVARSQPLLDEAAAWLDAR